MDLIKFVFPFLYARDWNSGKLELSHPRVALFSAMLFIVFLGVLMAVILQAPIIYVVGYVWFKIQNTLQDVGVESMGETVDFVPTKTTPVANTVPVEGIKINTNAVSDAQKSIAEKVGVDLDAVTITPEMVACAEVKIGSARVQEILDGASPTTMEGITMLSCV
jgi:hypothetical protein